MAMLTGIRYRDVYSKLTKCGAYIEGKGMMDTTKALIALGLKQSFIICAIVEQSGWESHDLLAL